mgnify:CR=1 FL=1
MITFDFTSGIAVLVYVCCFFFIVQLTYIFYIYSRIYRTQTKKEESPSLPLPPLSVIIVTKDSGSALEENLPLILEQDYPQYEVIVINDESAGEDEDILKRLSLRYPHLYYTFIPGTARHVSRKKLGLAIGIRASHYEWIVTTSPYCYPVSPNWLKELAKGMTPDTSIVLGYSNYTLKRGWFSHRIVVDSFFRSLRYLGMALAGHPYMGVGHNMAYRKSLYQNHKGFADHLQLQRGEDDLFINAVANRQNTRVIVSTESIVRTPTPPYKRIWFEEKMNAMVTMHYYRGTAKYFNSLETLSCACFHLFTAMTLYMSISGQQWIACSITALLWLTRFAIEMHVLHRNACALQESHLQGMFVVFDILRPFWSLTRHIQYLFLHKEDFYRK